MLKQPISIKENSEEESTIKKKPIQTTKRDYLKLFIQVFEGSKNFEKVKKPCTPPLQKP